MNKQKEVDVTKEVLSLLIRVPPERYAALIRDLEALSKRVGMKLIKGGKADPEPTLKGKFTL
jgi:hypothetical protein